ncbi:hypothetical protein H4J56_08655 [Colwellia sp. BRX8-4]|uniref:hypothetical protein n=1 Tax=Colwellia sp. BRX8-4 TaxID=2759836 RepID=UPI0015F41592|nr:hypothetical protein [Colwellia sp. BRX8-4]MBA6365607.1 hypothetical protein [Colwellia sp. BRX8-8]MBA6371497.1 hypothetical protein [Colwellia sp. BRX8-4]
MNILKPLFLSSLLTLTACSLTAYQEAENQPDNNYKEAESSLQFRFALRHLMPQKEVLYLERTLANAEYDPERWSQSMADEGFITSGLLSGGLDNSSAGAVGLIAKYAMKSYENRPTLPHTSFLVVPKSELPNAAMSVEEATDFYRQKTIDNIKETATEFGYSVKCIDNCTEMRPVFELNLLNNVTNHIYSPSVIVVSTSLNELRKPDDSLLSVFGDDTAFTSDYSGWVVSFYSLTLVDGDKVSYTTLNLPDGLTAKFPKNADPIISTPIGRDIYRNFSAKMKSWYKGTSTKDGYAVYNGTVYRLANISSFSKFTGYPTSN